MFVFLEKRHQKRIFFSYLIRFGLAPYNLNDKAMAMVLEMIYTQANFVARHFQVNVESVSRNIISAGAWGTIYCLLGPTRMLELEPEYRDIVEEVEAELMMSHIVGDSENSIYRQLFHILFEQGLCHGEVIALIEAGMRAASLEALFESGSAIGKPSSHD